ncbi:MAG: c-type cytochrome [Gammaproteobacteria bacterium]|nr:c-type cytochrome [Gammaproteobacteria bacterium]
MRALAVACALFLAACGGAESPATPDAAAPAAEPAAPVEPAAAPVEGGATAQLAPDPQLQAMLAAADLNKGKVLYLQCRACHSLVPEAESGKIGPTLYGVLGRAAGSIAGFAYSEAVQNSGITWSAEQIDAWLTRPSQFLPGNKMVFVGIQNPQDRADIIAFIQAESAKPAAEQGAP